METADFTSFITEYGSIINWIFAGLIFLSIVYMFLEMFKVLKKYLNNI